MIEQISFQKIIRASKYHSLWWNIEYWSCRDVHEQQVWLLWALWEPLPQDEGDVGEQVQRGEQQEHDHHSAGQGDWSVQGAQAGVTCFSRLVSFLQEL